MTRETAVAGQFYESDFMRLDKQIEDCYNSKLGPGDLPIKRSDKRNVSAIIAPHAGYQFSGPCAAWAHKEIAEAKFPQNIILLGPNHYSDKSALSQEDWKTPFGLIRTDKELVRQIKEATGIPVDEEAHAHEHSLEVQVPMLQFSNKDRAQDIRIVPLLLGNDMEYDVLAKKLSDLVKKTNRDITFVISSDFTHYGKNYHYVPFSSDIKERIIGLDKGAIDLIMDLDSDGFRKYVNETGMTICGYLPILVFLAMMEHAEKRPKPELLMHYTSGDVLNDFKNSVSYVSMVFRK
jgi:AmmeMemoRadiSam system protein B